MDKFSTRNCLLHGVFDCIDKSHIFKKDNEVYCAMRKYIADFTEKTIATHENNTILEIGPPNFEASKILSAKNTIETVDIVDNSKTTYVADLTKPNSIPKSRYDAIYCLEVIEHCSHPLNLLEELRKLLKSEGVLYLTFPFQFRLHGPIPDNWRISEYGIRILLADAGFEITQLEALIDEERPAFPISYSVICKPRA